MILSMTGYGRGEVKKDEFEILAEIRSLNNRFLDISARLPVSYAQYEQEVKNIVKKHLNRGRINVSITLKNVHNNKADNLKLDTVLARSYYSIIKELKSLVNLTGEIRLSDLITLPNIITYEEETDPQDEIWDSIQEVLEISLADLCKMRQQEGKELAKDLRKRIACLDDCIQKIETLAKERAPLELQKLNERIQQLMPNTAIDQGRLEMEIALLADRLDVTEECIRFRSHSKLFLDTFDSEESAGRRLNFVTQEMNREANTIGAKANDAEISKFVIQIKEEIEKIREQVQNIE